MLYQKCYILAQDSLEVELPDTLGGNLSGVDPNTHVNESGDKHANAYGEQTVSQDDIAGMGGSLRTRTNVCQVGCVLSGNMTEASCSLLDLGSRRWIIRVGVLDGSGEIDKVLGKIAKKQTHERLQRGESVSKGLYVVKYIF
jgi:hypothetical protein